MNRNISQKHGLAILCAAILVTTSGAAFATEMPSVTVSSGATRVALLELYTSEGCNSCPPAERWLGMLRQRGLGPGKIVPLAFHVDYWDYLGWKDPFAQARFGDRQRDHARRNRLHTRYTPQLVLNGRDFRDTANVRGQVQHINRSKPSATIEAQLTPAVGTLRVQAGVTVNAGRSSPQARLYLALYENDLTTAVKRGENAGRMLTHQHVVRSLSGPHEITTTRHQVRHTFRLQPEWQRAAMGLVLFVEDQRDGSILQTLAVPLPQGNMSLSSNRASGSGTR